MPPTMARPCTSSAIELAQVVASRGDARGYRVECRAGRVVTTRLATRYLGNGEAIPLVTVGADRDVFQPGSRC